MKTFKFIRLFFLISILNILPTIMWAQDAALLPNAKQSFFTNDGKPLSGGKVYFYVPNTSTLKTTWQDADGNVANTNPVILDSSGRAIIYGNGDYRQVVRDRNNNLIWDANTASTGTGGGGATTGDGDAVGTIKPWAALIAPNQYLFTYGQEISRNTYPELLTAITLNTSAFCSNGSPTLTGIADTTQIPIGAAVEVTCMAFGTVVVSKTSNSVTTNNNASLTTSSIVRFFPWGNGNGTTTFNLPDFRGRILAGRNNMGGINSTRLTDTYYGNNPNALGAAGGSETNTLTVDQIPSHNHGVDDPGHIHNVAVGVGGTQQNGGGGTFFSANDGPTNTTTSVTNVNILNTGGGQPHSIIQPTITSNYIIKVIPDTASTTNIGVTSINGMTGAITCGTGLLCSGNIIDTITKNTTNNLWSGLNSFGNGLEVLGLQNILVNPVGNSAINVYTSNSVNGTTQSNTNTEFLSYIGFISNKGDGVGSPGGNKVTLYTGIEGQAGSGWIWSQNPLTYLAPGFNNGAYVSEMDLQNHARHYDTGLSAPAAWVANLSYGSTGFGYRGNGYLLLSGTSGTAYTHYGIVITNDAIKPDTGYTFWDNANAFTSYRISGTHTYGIDTFPANLTKSFRIGPNQGIYARNSTDTNDIELIGVDGTDNVIVGDGFTQLYFKTTPKPFSNNTYAFGGPLLRFSTGYFVSTDQNNAIFNGSISGTTILNASTVASGTLTLPSATDTLIGKATTDTLTNKTLDSATLSNKLINGTYTIQKSAVQVSNTGNTLETILATIPIPANIGVNSTLKITAFFGANNNSNNKTVRIRYGSSGSGIGGTAVSATNITTQLGLNLVVTIANRNSASSQVATTGNSGGFGFAAPITLTVNTTNASEIVLTGQLATGTDTVSVESYIVELLS